jgi:hypothetical protein
MNKTLEITVLVLMLVSVRFPESLKGFCNVQALKTPVEPVSEASAEGA